MSIFQGLLLDYQYHKYVRQLPFYMIRDYGIKRFYLPMEVAFAISKYGFDTKHSFIGYAMFCKREAYDEATSSLKSRPTKDDIRKTIAMKYFNGKDDFTLSGLMKLSAYKSTWSGWDDPANGNDEYWKAMEQLDEQYVRKALNTEPTEEESK